MDWRSEVSIISFSQTCDYQRFEARKVVIALECLNIFVTGCILRSRRKFSLGRNETEEI